MRLMGGDWQIKIGAVLAALMVSFSMAGPSVAADDVLAVELNKFEDVDSGCRSFFLFRNRTEAPMEAFEMSLAILTSDGVIDRLLTIDAAPLPSGRTTLKLFEIPEIQCSAIGEVLLHDIASCRPQNGEEMDCFAILELGSKTAAPLVK